MTWNQEQEDGEHFVGGGLGIGVSLTNQTLHPEGISVMGGNIIDETFSWLISLLKSSTAVLRTMADLNMERDNAEINDKVSVAAAFNKK